MSKQANAAATVCRELFGELPEDVIAPIKSTSETLDWLHEIFVTIRNEALDERNSVRIRTLADAGQYLAFEASNYAGCQHEAMIQRLVDAGAAPKEALTR